MVSTEEGSSTEVQQSLSDCELDFEEECDGLT
jgi:hypothetical protein